MALSVVVQTENAHAVFCHGVERLLVLVQGSDIVMHHGHGVLRRVVDKRQRGEAIGVTQHRRLEAGVHGVPVVVVHQVFLKRGQRLTDLECCLGA